MQPSQVDPFIYPNANTTHPTLDIPALTADMQDTINEYIASAPVDGDVFLEPLTFFYLKPKLVLILYFTFLAYFSTDLTRFFCSAISVNYSTHPDPTLVGFGAVDHFFHFF
jgi:uncharacterized membrane protein YoaT (DUF817 family)